MYKHAQYVSHMGSDKDVANDARISFDALADMFTEEQNNRLIKFLARGVATKDWDSLVETLSTGVNDNHHAEKLLKQIKRMPEHWTPFAHNAIKIRMNAPVPIRTQCFKHKQGLVENEESRRYISSRPEVYIPDAFRSAPDGSIKQGSDGIHKDNKQWMATYEKATEHCVHVYMSMIDHGVCPEQARFILPQGCVVNWVWTGNLYAFANFYNKRTESHAQLEIQQVAHQVGEIIKPLFPVSWEALTN